MINYVGKCLLAKVDRKKILVVGDLHFGFEEALNWGGVFVSRQMYKESINYLGEIFKKIGKIDEIVLLGDVKHVFGKITKQEWEEISGFIDYLKKWAKQIIVIRGNHDKLIEFITRNTGVRVADFYIADDFCFLHGDRDFLEGYDSRVKNWVVGHGHPAIKVKEGVKVEKFKCFLVGKFKNKNVILMPSFFDQNLGSDPRENDLGYAWKFKLEKFRIMVIEDEGLGVLDFGQLGKLR
jgi:uncharacterized protein